MQVGKILDAVVGPTTAGMVEASKELAADSEMMQMGPESSEMMPNSPVLPRGSPTSVLTVWEPTESMVVSLCRLQRAFRLRRRLTPVAVTCQRLWRGRQVRSGVLYGGGVWLWKEGARGCVAFFLRSAFVLYVVSVCVSAPAEKMLVLYLGIARRHRRAHTLTCAQTGAQRAPPAVARGGTLPSTPSWPATQI